MDPEALVALSASEALWDAVPVRRCRRCLEWFPEEEEYFRRGTAGYLGRRCRECDKSVRKEQYRDNHEHRLEQQAAYRERLNADPERLAERRSYRREWMRAYRERAKEDPIARERLRQWDRSYREKLRRDPRRHEEALASARIGYVLRARQRGIPAMPTRSRRGIDVERERNYYLPAAPLRALIDSLAKREGVEPGRMAEDLGLAARRAYDLMEARQECVRFDTADRVLTSLGMPMSDIYPEET